MTTIVRVPSQPIEFFEYIKNTKKMIYIFGADIAGKIVQKMLLEQSIQIDGFLDNNKNKCLAKIDGADVFVANDKLDKISKDSVILIASTYISDIIRQLEDVGFYNWVPIIDFLESKDENYFRECLKGDLRKNHSGGEFTNDFDVFVLENMLNSQKKYLDETSLYIRSVDIVITEKCSLKCKDCSNLMQYYESPQNISFEVVKQEIDNICSVADEINELRIIGGDAFMNKDFPAIVNYAATKNNVNKVVIYTNGTISPQEDKIKDIAKSEKIFVFITTYGDLSRNAQKLVDCLESAGVQYNRQPAYGWTDCGEIVKQDRNEEAQTKIFQNCCAKHFTTLTDGKLFRCPFAANLHRLSATPDFQDDYVQMQDISTLDQEESQEYRVNLKKYLREISYINYCDFCNGRTYGDPEIEPGIQTKIPLKYVKFSKSISSQHEN